jgi:HEAT repeat protein
MARFRQYRPESVGEEDLDAAAERDDANFLLPVAEDRDEKSIRRYSALMLLRLVAKRDPGSAEWFDRLVRLLDFKKTRQGAIAVLGELPSSERILKVLDAELDHTKKNERITAVRALESTGDPKAEPLLEKALGDKSPLIRHEALKSINVLDGPDASRLIKSKRTDRNPWVATYAMWLSARR